MSTPRDPDAGLPILASGHPVLGFCGYSGSGKTTALEALLPRLIARGWRVAVLKHDAHGAQVDRAHKDSARFFDAGADVYLSAPEQRFYRRHPSSDTLDATLRMLLFDHDLVLVEGHKDTPLPKLWFDHPQKKGMPPNVTQLEQVVPWDRRDPDSLESWVVDWLDRRWKKTPLMAGVLIGGDSRRMGRAKHLIRNAQGQTWVEATVQMLQPLVAQVVVLGDGELPGSLAALPRLCDVIDTSGPLAGVLGAMRWAPQHGWLMLACDMPDVSDTALHWLLDQRAPGRWMIVPWVESGRPEPLCAWYDARARGSVEQLVASGKRALRELRDRHGWFCPQVPAHLTTAWRNVNGPADL